MNETFGEYMTKLRLAKPIVRKAKCYDQNIIRNEYFRSIKGNEYSVPIRKNYYSILRRINELIAERVINGHTVALPAKMGCFRVVKKKKKLAFEDGKLKTNLGIDWGKTHRLWYSDEQAREKKILIRREYEDIFFFQYDRGKNYCSNLIYYEFAFSRIVKKKLHLEILKNKNYDALEHGGKFY